MPEHQRDDIVDLLHSYTCLSNVVPSCTNILEHDIDVSAAPLNNTLPLSVRKKRINEKKSGLAKPSHSPWSTTCLLARPAFVQIFEKLIQ